MQARQLGILGFLMLAMSIAADARQPRSHRAITEFKAMHPCPATGLPRGRCPGYIIDHVIPLCAGGPDTPDNMQWQTVEDAKRKDHEERRQCKQVKAIGNS